MTENSDRIERTLEVLLYAPIGVGLFLKDAAPNFVDMFVARGRAEIDRRQGEVQQHVTTARSLGQVAMAFGPPMVRQRVEQTVADAKRKAEGLLGSPASSPTPPSATAPSATAPSARAAASAPTPPAAPAVSDTAAPAAPAPAAAPTTEWTAVTNGDRAASADLPIPGYDALSASQVVERLVGLAPAELDAVHDYETTHRQRRTILGKIEQLAG